MTEIVLKPLTKTDYYCEDAAIKHVMVTAHGIKNHDHRTYVARRLAYHLSDVITQTEDITQQPHQAIVYPEHFLCAQIAVAALLPPKSTENDNLMAGVGMAKILSILRYRMHYKQFCKIDFDHFYDVSRWRLAQRNGDDVVSLIRTTRTIRQELNQNFAGSLAAAVCKAHQCNSSGIHANIGAQTLIKHYREYSAFT